LEVRLEGEEKVEVEKWATLPGKSFCVKDPAGDGLMDNDGVTIDLMQIEDESGLLLYPSVINNSSYDALKINRNKSVFTLTFVEITLEDDHVLSEMVLVQAHSAFRDRLPGAASVSIEVNCVCSCSCSACFSYALLLCQVMHVGIVERPKFSDFKFRRTSTITDRQTRGSLRSPSALHARWRRSLRGGVGE
jgi:hypothetical protein